MAKKILFMTFLVISLSSSGNPERIRFLCLENSSSDNINVDQVGVTGLDGKIYTYIKHSGSKYFELLSNKRFKDSKLHSDGSRTFYLKDCKKGVMHEHRVNVDVKSDTLTYTHYLWSKTPNNCEFDYPKKTIEGSWNNCFFINLP